ACRQAARPSRYQFGLSGIPLNEQLARAFKLKEAAGLLITEVKAGSLGERQGLKAGDCLLTANGKPVTSVSELNRLLNREGETAVTTAKGTILEISLVMVRDGNEQTLKFSLP
ncbi:MAG: PDZ domain-containing protein, partial [Deltaproteobacteria bacterium]|nr:PDZ domain-containing protein [Deltaproteobacteria bacterium]